MAPELAPVTVVPNASLTAACEPRLTVVDPTNDELWDKAVASFPAAGFFHSSAWIKAISASYKHAPRALIHSDQGVTCGCLPVIEVDSWLTGKRGISLPFTDECHPLASSDPEAKALIQRAIQYGASRGWRYFLLHGGGGLMDESRTSDPTYYTHLIDLRKSAQEVFAGFSDPVRRAIRKSQRESIDIETTTSEEGVRAYYSLHCITRQKHGLPPQPWIFFQQVFRQAIARGMGFVVLARASGQLAAGAVFLGQGKSAVFKYGASNLAFQNLRPNNLVMWEAIQQLIKCGTEVLSLGRTSISNEGLRRFKLGWSPSEIPLWYLRYDFERQQFVRELDAATGWHNRVFRKLPRVFSRIAGAFLYRHFVWLPLGVYLQP